MNNQSLFDPNRKTVGAISNEIRKADTKSMLIGDVNHEMLKGLVDDINQALDDGRMTFPNQDFYVLVTEKWEIQMKNALVRKVAVFKRRPYPEANTTCFKYDSKKREVLYCWDLPIRHEMWNVQAASEIFDPQVVQDIKAWENNEMEHFGLMKVGIGDLWVENPHFQDRPMIEKKPTVKIFS
jgi:hypothetical protein